jgi:surface antigen/uncharacterized low-complexity protein
MTNKYPSITRFSAAISAIATVFLFSPAQSAFAQTDEQSHQEETETSGAAVDGSVGEERQAPDGDPAKDEGASSFSDLCGNGQGKPEEGEVREKRKGLFGLADRVSAMTRKIPLVGDFLVDSANSLSQSISCRLYPEEQKQAIEATQEATRSEEIGKTVEWKSTVRDNVSGSSTVAAKSQLPNGTPCLTVSDIIIVEGEELRVSKQMCRLPGASRYTIVTA